MTFSELQAHARLQNYENANFIFANTVGTILHGTWFDADHFSIHESPSQGLVSVDDWIRLGGESFHYVAIK